MAVQLRSISWIRGAKVDQATEDNHHHEQLFIRLLMSNACPIYFIQSNVVFHTLFPTGFTKTRYSKRWSNIMAETRHKPLRPSPECGTLRRLTWICVDILMRCLIHQPRTKERTISAKLIWRAQINEALSDIFSKIMTRFHSKYRTQSLRYQNTGSWPRKSCSYVSSELPSEYDVRISDSNSRNVRSIFFVKHTNICMHAGRIPTHKILSRYMDSLADHKHRRALGIVYAGFERYRFCY